MIAKEPAAAEIQSGKNPVPVGNSDADRIEKVRSLFDQRAAYLDRRQLDIRLRRETVDRVVQGKQSARFWTSVVGTALFRCRC